jgi:predicted RNase H-like HicB family nuclease
MVEIQPLRIEIGREEDGRFLASVPDLPGMMAYRDTPESALRKAKVIALQVLADMMKSGEEPPQPLRVLFAAQVPGVPQKPGASTLRRPDWVDIKEAGRLSQKAAKARLAKLHVLLSRQWGSRPAALAKIAKDTGLRPEDL